ncbi:MAG: hypothetical protein IKL23_03140 [Oscillospiraceae bacterium]|nr:hypothetical protein [Oscillospiraceae bacterium]
MSTNELTTKVHELRELRRMAEELAAEIESLQDTIKAEMIARSTEEISGTDWSISWKPVKSSRLDTAALRKAMPDVAAAFTRETVSRRFLVA